MSECPKCHQQSLFVFPPKVAPTTALCKNCGFVAVWKNEDWKELKAVTELNDE